MSDSDARFDIPMKFIPRVFACQEASLIRQYTPRPSMFLNVTYVYICLLDVLDFYRDLDHVHLHLATFQDILLSSSGKVD